MMSLILEWRALVMILAVLILICGPVAWGDAPSGNEELYRDLAYDPVNDRYLYVFNPDNRIMGRLLDRNGEVIGSDFAVGDNPHNQRSSCRVAFDTIHERYLVVWVDGRTGGVGDIYGQFVNASGDLYATASSVNFPIADNFSNQSFNPTVDYSESADMFLVAFQRDYSDNIYGQFVSDSEPGFLFSTTSTQNFAISAYTGVGTTWPRVVADTSDDMFLVVWLDDRDSRYNIYGQFVSPSESGFLYSTDSSQNFAIAYSTDFMADVDVAFSSADARFLVVWEQQVFVPPSSLLSDIHGQFVSRTEPSFLFSTTAEENFVIADNLLSVQDEPEVEYDPVSGSFLAVWHDSRGDSDGIYGQVIGASGNHVGTASTVNALVSTTSWWPMHPVLENNTECGNFLLAYAEMDEMTFIGHGIELLGDPCSRGGGGGGGCSTAGPVQDEPVWPEVLWITLLGTGFFLWRRRRRI